MKIFQYKYSTTNATNKKILKRKTVLLIESLNTFPAIILATIEIMTGKINVGAINKANKDVSIILRLSI